MLGHITGVLRNQHDQLKTHTTIGILIHYVVKCVAISGLNTFSYFNFNLESIIVILIFSCKTIEHVNWTHIWVWHILLSLFSSL